jgi:hypothetical protein
VSKIVVGLKVSKIERQWATTFFFSIFGFPLFSGPSLFLPQKGGGVLRLGLKVTNL